MNDNKGRRIRRMKTHTIFSMSLTLTRTKISNFRSLIVPYRAACVESGETTGRSYQSRNLRMMPTSQRIKQSSARFNVGAHFVLRDHLELLLSGAENEQKSIPKRKKISSMTNIQEYFLNFAFDQSRVHFTLAFSKR